MAEIRQNPRMLTSKKEIQVYLGNASDYIFKKYVKSGLPARYEDGRWYASTVNIDLWWDAFTRVSAASIIDKIPENGDG